MLDSVRRYVKWRYWLAKEVYSLYGLKAAVNSVFNYLYWEELIDLRYWARVQREELQWSISEVLEEIEEKHDLLYYRDVSLEGLQEDLCRLYGKLFKLEQQLGLISP